MDYQYDHGDEDVLVMRLGPHFGPYSEPMDVQMPLRDDPVWEYIRPDLQLVGNRLLRLELEEDGHNSARVTLAEYGGPTSGLRLSDQEQILWRAVAAHPDVPQSMEVIVRDLLLSAGVDTTPANAERVVDGYRAMANGPDNSLHVALAILRAGAIARSRRMPVEGAVRAETLTLAERVLSVSILPGLALRHAAAVADLPRSGVRAANELNRLAAVLDHIEAEHRDASTIDWVAKCRLAAASSDEDREVARRQYVEQYLAIADSDDVPFRAMVWAEKAVALATDFGFQDLHDAAVVRMQRLSRTDLGWHHRVADIQIPISMIRQRERSVAKLASWEQALGLFLSSESPSGNTDRNERQASGLRRGLLDLVTGRTFGSHQLPERTHGPAELENLNRVVETNLHGATITLRIDLDAVASRFGVPAEKEITTFLSSAFGSAPLLASSFAKALRLYWSGDPSSSARLTIPLIEAGARELLFLMDQPLYRMERGGSPGRFPAMDFYLEKLEQVGLDVDWVTALRASLLSGGMNLRNRLAHGFQLEFSAGEAALLLRLAGLFIGMPVGTQAIDDERIRTPLAQPRKPLRRRLGWIWR